MNRFPLPTGYHFPLHMLVLNIILKAAQMPFTDRPWLMMAVVEFKKNETFLKGYKFNRIQRLPSDEPPL